MTLFLLFVLVILIGVAIYLFVLKKNKSMLPQKIEKPGLPLRPPAPPVPPPIPPRPPAPPTPPAPPQF